MPMIENLRHIRRPHTEPDGFEPQLGSFGVDTTAVEQHLRELTQGNQPPAADLGKITADVIKASHEAVAQALSVLATELADNVRNIEQLKTNAEESMKMCLDIAERARERGKQDAERIAAATERNEDIRDIIENARKRLED